MAGVSLLSVSIERYKPFREHLRMIRHARWWDENAAHIKRLGKGLFLFCG